MISVVLFTMMAISSSSILPSAAPTGTPLTIQPSTRKTVIPTSFLSSQSPTINLMTSRQYNYSTTAPSVTPTSPIYCSEYYDTCSIGYKCNNGLCMQSCSTIGSTSTCPPGSFCGYNYMCIYGPFATPETSSPVSTSSCASGYIYQDNPNCFCTSNDQCSSSRCSTFLGEFPGNVCLCELRRDGIEVATFVSQSDFLTVTFYYI